MRVPGSRLDTWIWEKPRAYATGSRTIQHRGFGLGHAFNLWSSDHAISISFIFIFQSSLTLAQVEERGICGGLDARCQGSLVAGSIPAGRDHTSCDIKLLTPCILDSSLFSTLRPCNKTLCLCYLNSSTAPLASKCEERIKFGKWFVSALVHSIKFGW